VGANALSYRRCCKEKKEQTNPMNENDNEDLVNSLDFLFFFFLRDQPFPEAAFHLKNREMRERP